MSDHLKLKKKLEPDVVDNITIKMSDVLNNNLSRITSLYISSGYFDLSGYGMIHKALDQAIKKDKFQFRLLVGIDAIKTTKFDTFEEYRQEHMYSMEQSLANTSFDINGMDMTNGLLELLKNNNVSIKHNNRRFNHAKCYILGSDGAIVGSSNFTGSGLVGNAELNVGIYQTGPMENILNWFDRMWTKADDAKQDLIQILEQSKFGITPNPYDIYIKMLYEMFKPTLKAMLESDLEKANLPKFQQDAVATSMQIISMYNGVIIADSTGLGKTHIGLEIIRQKTLDENRNVLLIAPSQVLHTVWKDKLNEAKVVVDTISSERLGRSDFEDNIKKYKKIDLVVIDESQNFRSSSANRRKNLMKLMSTGVRKQAILLSATPINNSIMDLYYQLNIITSGDDSYFTDIGIPDLYDHMRKAANKETLGVGLEKIQQILDVMMVRRTRSFVEKIYPNEKINGLPIKFPTRKYAAIRYNITELFGDVYTKVLDVIDSLEMAPYGIERYNLKLSEEDRNKHKTLAHLQKITILKRFESSIEAVRVTITNKIRLYNYFNKILINNKIISVNDFNKIMRKWNTSEIIGYDADEIEEDREIYFMNEIKKLPTVSATDYDIETIKNTVKDDLKKLCELLSNLETITPKFDKKIQAVAERIQSDKALCKESKKVLIFTEYATTARYVEKNLKEYFPDKTILRLTGSTNIEQRKKFIRRFSPTSNLGVDEEFDNSSEIDILISTEVLSEGQNLQDCNYVLNYDLPWNPMRIVQRIGRIDRLTSKFDSVYCRDCMPDTKLDKLLKLMGRLMYKISIVDKVIGIDTGIIGEDAHPREFNGNNAKRIRILAGENGIAESNKLITTMEHESDMMPERTPINEITQYMTKTTMDKMNAVPFGRRSGKHGDSSKVILAYLQEQPKRRFHTVMFNNKTNVTEVIENSSAMEMIQCTEDTEKYLPGDNSNFRHSFEQLLAIDEYARNAIIKKSNSDIAIAKSVRKKQDKDIDKIKNILKNAVIDTMIPLDESETVCNILNSNSLRPWNDDIHKILIDYDRTNDVKIMLSDINSLAKKIGIGKQNDVIDIHELKPLNLILIGAMFIVGKNMNWIPSITK